jgi:hypothetical protein
LLAHATNLIKAIVKAGQNTKKKGLYKKPPDFDIEHEPT